MKTLWTPWRMEYILSHGNKKECIFDAAIDTRFDKKHLILYRDKLVVVLLNRFPYANGHLLVAPARHLPDISDLSATESCALFQMIRSSVIILRKQLNPHGFNIGLNLDKVAGAGLAEHLHFHIVPRWEGDHNYMTVVADIRTIPEHIDKTFDKLLPDFQALETFDNN